VQVKDVLVVGVDLGINGILNINAMDNTPDDHISKKNPDDPSSMVIVPFNQEGGGLGEFVEQLEGPDLRRLSCWPCLLH
jgi:hypothetical protein